MVVLLLLTCFYPDGYVPAADVGVFKPRDFALWCVCAKGWRKEFCFNSTGRYLSVRVGHEAVCEDSPDTVLS
jgi:hypothetical protein